VVGLTSLDIQRAIAVERAVRAAGACLFLDGGPGLWVLYPDKLTAELTQLCRDNYNGLKWLITVRASL